MIKHLNLKVDSYGLSTFFFYHVPADLEVDYDEVELVTNQNTAGLLPLTLLKRDEELYVRYDQIADINVASFFSKTLNKEHLTTYLVNIVDSIADMEASGVNLERILLNKHYIFLDHFSNRLVFMYMPIKNNVFEKVSMKEFFRDLVAATNYDEMDDLSFFIKLHNLLADDEELHLDEFKKWLLESTAKVETNEGQPSSEDSEETDSNFYSPGGVFTSQMTASEDNGVLTSEYSSRKVDKKTNQKLEIEEELQYKRITRTELGEGESLVKGAGGTSINIVPNMNPFSAQATVEQEDVGTTVLGAYPNYDLPDEGTTVLGFGNQPVSKPFLLSSKLEEKIMVTKAQFKIGRDPEQADYASKNRVIGRVHAEVVNEDGEYFLIDNDSRNGSYVNGKRLLPNEKMKLKHEDRIKLANEEFVFKLF